MAKSADAFRTISEVADWLGVPTHVLRFWESKFPQVKPVKRAGGRRYYRPSDMLLLAGIRVLLHDDGVTIRGVQKVLREKGVKHVTGLADREVSETDNTPAPTTPDTAAPDLEDAKIVDLPRKDPAPQVIVKAPEPAAVPAEDTQADTVLEVDSDQMALFSRSETAATEPEPENTSAASEAVEGVAEKPPLDLPGPSPVSTTSLSRLRALTNLQDDATAQDLRAALAQQRGSLQALRDRLAEAPADTGSDPEA